ncbi:MAG: YqgE/AlgH family protein [Spirochaetales bacterium]
MNSGQIPTDSSGEPIPAVLDGYFLVSETELVDPNFLRTVVLIVSHSEEGAFGLVVNRPSDVSLGEIIADYENDPLGGATAFVGGPVEQHYLFTLHSGIPREAQSEYALTPTGGIVFEPAFGSIGEYLRKTWIHLPPGQRPTFNFYLGYAGWSPGQLEREIAQGAWLVIPADPGIVFHTNPEEGWQAALRQKGGLYEIIAQTGFKPSLN